MHQHTDRSVAYLLAVIVAEEGERLEERASRVLQHVRWDGRPAESFCCCVSSHGDAATISG
jgi:hypothetical protein